MYRARHTASKLTLILLGMALVSLAAAPALQAAEHRLGLGIHYWRTVDNLDDLNNLEDNGTSYIASYQFKPRGLFKLELDLEVFGDGFGGSTETAYAPQAFVLVGGFVYGGVGVGTTYSNDLPDTFSDPFFMAKLGLDFALLGPLRLDVGAIYRFDDWASLQQIDLNTDTFTLGVIGRIEF